MWERKNQDRICDKECFQIGVKNILRNRRSFGEFVGWIKTASLVTPQHAFQSEVKRQRPTSLSD